MTVTRSKFSERQAGRAVAVDVLALSPQARRDILTAPAGQAALVVQNTTKYLSIPIAITCRVINAYLNFVTAPAASGGTATIQIDHVAVDGSTTTNIVASVTILSGFTAKIPVALTLAATNPSSCAAGGSFLVTVVTSNHTVGTADAGACVSLGVEAVEDTVINDTNAAVAG